MLGVTASGDAYTFGEYQRMLRDAGFKSIETRRVEGDILNNYYIAYPK